MQKSSSAVAAALANSLNQQRVRRSAPCQVSIYPHGTITNRGSFGIVPGVCGARRGVIRRFSRASAARLRRLLATTCGPDGWQCIGATLTVPGPVITAEEFRRVWDAFRMRLSRLQCVALIWRIELQERGQPHLHCVCWFEHCRKLNRVLYEGWLDCLGLLGPAEGPCHVKDEGYSIDSEYGRCDMKPGWAKVEHRGNWPGAFEHAINVKGLDENDDFSWWRYLAAHASKSKQAQLGWQGRQWGVMGGQNIRKAAAEICELSDKALNKVIRCLRRVTGCRYASGHGRQTWFGQPGTVKRLCEWAKTFN